MTAPINVSVAGQQVPLFIQPNSNYHDLALLPDGRILVAGTAIVPNLGEYVGLAMFLPNGTRTPRSTGPARFSLVLIQSTAFNPIKQ